MASPCTSGINYHQPAVLDVPSEKFLGACSIFQTLIAISYCSLIIVKQVVMSVLCIKSLFSVDQFALEAFLRYWFSLDVERCR